MKKVIPSVEEKPAEIVSANQASESKIYVLEAQFGIPYRLRSSEVVLDGSPVKVYSWKVAAPSVGMPVPQEIKIDGIQNSNDMKEVINAASVQAEKNGWTVNEYESEAEYGAYLMTQLLKVSTESMKRAGVSETIINGITGVMSFLGGKIDKDNPVVKMLGLDKINLGING